MAVRPCPAEFAEKIKEPETVLFQALWYNVHKAKAKPT